VKWTFGLVAIAALVAGCSGSHHSDRAAIRAVLAASPETYLHYGARTWGRKPHLHVRIRVAGDDSTAVLSAPRTVSQRIALRRRGSTWSIASADPGIIKGPRAERRATADELAAISAAGQQHYPGSGSCITYAAHISRLDPHYSRVDYVFSKSALAGHGKCAKFVGNGEEVYTRGPAGWHYVGGASDGFPCSYLPPGVVRSLFGVCWTFK